MLRDNSYLCLKRKSLSVRAVSGYTSRVTFPLERCHKVSMILSLRLISRGPPKVLTRDNVNVTSFGGGFYTSNSYFIVQTGSRVRRVFSRLCSMPSHLRGPCFVLGIRRLLLFLYVISMGGRGRQRLCASPRIRVMQSVRGQLVSGLRRQPAVRRLSGRCLVGATALGSAFGKICKRPVKACVGICHVGRTTTLLHRARTAVTRVTDRIKCRGRDGFTATFQSIVGVTPTRCQGRGDNS